MARKTTRPTGSEGMQPAGREGAEVFFLAAFDALLSRIAILDADGIIVAVNEPWRRFARETRLGLPDDGVGSNYLHITDLSHGHASHGAQEVAQGIRDVLAGRRDAFSLVYPCHSPLERHWFRVDVSRFETAEGVWVVTEHEEVTAQRLAEEALEAALRERKAVMDALPDIVYELDPAGRLVGWNRQLEEVSGFKGDALSHRPVLEFFFEEHRPRVLEALSRKRQGLAEHLEADLRRPDGTVVPYEFLSVPLVDEQGGLWRIVGVGRDITERKRAEETLRLQRDRLQGLTRELRVANEELEAFSYSVSHDLKAPMRAIDYLSQSLIEDHSGDLPADAQAAQRRLRVESRRMTQLIDDLLTLSRSTRGGIAIQPVDLSALAQSVLLQLHAREPSRAVETRIQPGVAGKGDPDLLRVVLENILGNAWKYTRKTPHPVIEFGGSAVGGGWTYFVRDNGAGFDMAEAGRIFRPFQRLHSAKEFEGTGIGLATVQRIIARHGGRVWAESEGPGKGATFHFTLPERGAGA